MKNSLKEKQNIPYGWQGKRLIDACDIVNGSTPSTSKPAYWDGLINWYTPNDLKYQKINLIESERKISDEGLRSIGGKTVQANSVILSTRAPIGYLGITSTCASLNQGCKGLVPHDGLSEKFLYYLLFNNKKTLNGLGSGSTFLELSSNNLASFVVLVPPIAEQQKIAEILGTVDEDIAKTQEVIDATEKLKHGLMQQLFTRGIGHTKFKETKIGQIPEGWEVQKLENFIKSLDAGVSVNSRDIQKENGEIGILKTSAVTFGVFDPNQHKTVVSEEVTRVAIPVKADRLIVSRMNTRDLVGANAYTNKSYSDLFLPDRLWQVEPKDEKVISMRWLSYIFNLQWKNGVFASLATGTSASMKNLSKGSILNMELSFPKIEEQEKIAEILSAVDEKISVNKKLKDRLTLLKKGLMQDLLSGQKRVV